MMNNVERLFQYEGSDPDHAHEECLALLAAYVEAEMSGQESDRLYPTVRAHLDQCEKCDAEYAALLEIALAEERGELPPLVSAPPLKLPAEVQRQQLARQVTRATLNILNPQWLSELDVVAQTFFERVRESVQRLNYEPSSLPLGLGSQDSPVLPTMMAAHYALEALRAKYALSDIRLMIQSNQLGNELRRFAHEEAGRLGLPRDVAQVFEENFAKEVEAAAKSSGANF